jgi:hypothetical protein
LSLVLSARAQRPGSQPCEPPGSAKAGPGAETETALDNKSAVAFEKHRIRLRMAGGGGMARIPRIYSRAPALRPLLHHRRSCPR